MAEEITIEESLLTDLKKLLEGIERLQTMQVFQLIEMNRLMKKLNYISGTDQGISPEEIADEIKFLGEYIDCINKKGNLCPIRGIVRKFDKATNEQERNEI